MNEKKLFLFTGTAELLLKEKRLQWTKLFQEKYGAEGEVVLCDVEKEPLEDSIAHVTTLPLFTPKRLVFLKGIPCGAKVSKQMEEKEQAIRHALGGIPEGVVVVCISESPDRRKSFYKELVKNAGVEEFHPLEGRALEDWVIKRLEGKCTREDAQYLITRAGGEMWNLATECEKLLLLADGERISEEMIRAVVKPALSTTVFAFTDALSAKKAKESILLLKELLAYGEDPFMVFAMIMRQCRLLAAFKEEKDPEGLAKLLKLHPFVVKKLHSQKNHFSHPQLQHMLEVLRTIDRQMKTGEIRIATGDAEELLGALERFIVVDVCGKG